MLDAPQFLSGLTDVELAMVKARIEAHALPAEIAEAKVAVAKALCEVETGWERAQAKIASCGGSEKNPAGPVSTAPKFFAIDTPCLSHADMMSA